MFVPHPSSDQSLFSEESISNAVEGFRKTLMVVRDRTSQQTGCFLLADQSSNDIWSQNASTNTETLGALPPLYPEWLGDRSFAETHGTRFAYIGGAMANGIATTKMVISLAQAGMLGFFGAAGLPAHKVEAAIDELKHTLDPQNLPWGSNLIYSPEEPYLEESVADLYIKKGVLKVSASAYMSLTPAVVRYACSGLYKNSDGSVGRKHFLFAKISRPEVAQLFMSPAPEAILNDLLAKGLLSAEEVALAKHIPLAEDITVEADSGGHTDQQALTAVFPKVCLLRDTLVRQFGYQKPIRVGAAGGLGSPNAVAAAYAMGAAYVLTGTVNQACIESGLGESGRALLADASIGDVVMTPASDMFEIGVKLQVLKKGTMYPVRAAKLYDVYTQYESLDDIPEPIAQQIEKTMLRQSFAEAWESTAAFWNERDPSQITKAEQDPKHKMALVFRSYLGLSSRWAMVGDQERKMDYQIWCGPAIAAFNEWTRGSFLENYKNRQVVQVALNLLEGAAAATRASQMRTYGLPVPASAFHYPPRPMNVAV